MNTTHDDNATTWRDLTDQLTPEQVRRFEHHERLALNSIAAGRNPNETADDIARGFLTEARWEAEQNLTDAMISVPVPPGAESAEHWGDGADGWTRMLHGPSRVVEGFDATVYRTGLQTQDGAVTWSLYVHVADSDDMTAAQVRQLAAALVEAADELEALQ